MLHMIAGSTAPPTWACSSVSSGRSSRMLLVLTPASIQAVYSKRTMYKLPIDGVSNRDAANTGCLANRNDTAPQDSSVDAALTGVELHRDAREIPIAKRVANIRAGS